MAKLVNIVIGATLDARTKTEINFNVILSGRGESFVALKTDGDVYLNVNRFVCMQVLNK